MGVPKNLGANTCPDPVVHFGAPYPILGFTGGAVLQGVRESPRHRKAGIQFKVIETAML